MATDCDCIMHIYTDAKSCATRTILTILSLWYVGQRKIRPYWRNYFDETDVLVGDWCHHFNLKALLELWNIHLADICCGQFWSEKIERVRNSRSTLHLSVSVPLCLYLSLSLSLSVSVSVSVSLSPSLSLFLNFTPIHKVHWLLSFPVSSRAVGGWEASQSAGIGLC